MFELGEDLFDWIEIWAVGWQEQEMRADCTDRTFGGFAFMGAKIVEDDNVTSYQCRHEYLAHIGREDIAIDRPVDHPRRIDAVMAQGGNEGQRLPVAMWHARFQPLTARSPASQGGHVRLDPRLIEEDEATGINLVLMSLPSHPFAGDIRT